MTPRIYNGQFHPNERENPSEYKELMRFDCNTYTVKPVLSGHLKTRPKIGFQDQLSLNAGQKYCRMLQESILQYFQPALNYHLSLRPLFCLFLIGRSGQAVLIIIIIGF